jgi:hypothetical protein
MEVVICHLTRMKAPHICIAGFDRTSGTHIRPVLQAGQVQPGILDCNGGCVNMASLVDLGPVRDVGQKPELEDREFNPALLKSIKTLAQWDFWGLLLANSRDSLADVFGDDLKGRGYSLVVGKGSGSASLGFLFPGKAPVIGINAHNKIRIKLEDRGQPIFLSLADLRFYDRTLEAPLPKTVEMVSRKLKSGVKSILSVGLTRPWAKPGEHEFHWLQVNNIHLEDDPTWQLTYQ